MVDSRNFLPQHFGGGNSGDDCARVYRPQPIMKKNPTVQRSAFEERPHLDDGSNAAGLVEASRIAYHMDPINILAAPIRLPGSQTFQAGNESVPFSGTKCLDWMGARARSTGCLDHAAIKRVLDKRTTTDFDDLVTVLQHAMSKERRHDLREFARPYNPHRHTMVTHITDDQTRRRILRTLYKFPLCDILDLAQCKPELWSEISRELGGVTHGCAMRCAMEHTQVMAPVDRAALWTGAGTRQAAIDQMRTISFASSDSSKKVTKKREKMTRNPPPFKDYSFWM
eukprot:TRINITY_DN54757_c0_g1_i1.p1 TRINITY_DN54757_c0_g1~~TRINITY_DN54757_c0_g1_i1.p1  ORF type:complete len:323 (-),score=31.07 TRINITY_DN54757_c0_g1_i1:60-908(-)